VLRIYNEEFTLPQIAHNARAAVIGKVTKRPQYVLQYGDDVVMDVPIEFLTGTIRDELPYTEIESPEAVPERPFVTGIQLDELLERVLAHGDVCSRQPLYRHYDSVVRGRTVLPRGVADAGVLAPVPGSLLGMALSVAGNPRYSHIDPRLAAEHAVFEAVRKVVAVGARPIGLTDCLNFGNPRKLEHYSEFVTAINGLAKAANTFKTPFVSGNVSLYNESANGKAIPASPIIACVGALQDVSRVVTRSLKRAGSILYLIGHPQAPLGASVLLDVIGRYEPVLPRINYPLALAHNELMYRAADSGILRSARAVSNGGLLVALCEMAFGTLGRGQRPVGVHLDDPWQWTHGGLGELEALFGEGGGFVVEVDAAGVEAFEKLVENLEGIDDVDGIYEIGVTIDEPVLTIADETFDLNRLHDVWKKPLVEVYP